MAEYQLEAIAAAARSGRPILVVEDVGSAGEASLQDVQAAPHHRFALGLAR
jgi:hypothetical protein